MLSVRDINARRGLHSFYFTVKAIIHKLTKGSPIQRRWMTWSKNDQKKWSVIGEEIFKLDKTLWKQHDILAMSILEKIDKIKLQIRRSSSYRNYWQKRLLIQENKPFLSKVLISLKAQSSLGFTMKERILMYTKVMSWMVVNGFPTSSGASNRRNSFFEHGNWFWGKEHDVLKSRRREYKFEYPDEKLIALGPSKAIVDDKARYTDWSQKPISKPNSKSIWS